MTETVVDDLKLLDTIVTQGDTYVVTEIMYAIETIRLTATRINKGQIDMLRKLAWNKLGICAKCLKEVVK